MPKLDSKTAAAVESSEAVHGGDFEPLLPGRYLARLSNVEVRDQKNKHGALQWNAEFEEIHSLETGERQIGRQWLNLTLPSSAKPPASYANGPEKWEKYQNLLRGRLAAFFEAFGYTSDSDTDEMLGEWAVIKVSQRTIETGPKQGQITNQVDDVLPVPEDVELPEVDDPDDVAF